MQVKYFFNIAFLPLLIMASCHKKQQDAKDYPVEGNYVGKYSALNGPYDKYYSFSIEMGGVLKLQDASGHQTGEGSWKLTGDSMVIKGSYTLLSRSGTAYSFAAKVNHRTGRLEGAWGNGRNETGGGHWFMKRTN